jgi:DNA-binding transcriptional MerR regulator
MSDARGNGPETPTYTIDELAEVSGVPARTIRFYQAEGLLPWPEKRGRQAIYRNPHLERLQAISVMQHRGLQLAAIRDLLTLDDADRVSVLDWLGLHADALAPVAPRAVDLTEAELIERLGADHAHLVDDLEAVALVDRLPDGHFRLPLPSLLDIALQFHDVGVQVRTSGRLAAIISAHLTDAAEEILTFVRTQMGETFAGSRESEDILRTLRVVDRLAIDAVGLLWADVMRRAVREFQGSLEEAFPAPDGLDSARTTPRG